MSVRVLADMPSRLCIVGDGPVFVCQADVFSDGHWNCAKYSSKSGQYTWCEHAVHTEGGLCVCRHPELLVDLALEGL